MITNTLENFRIYQDGELDKVAYARQKATVIGGTMLTGIASYGEQVGQAFGELAGRIGQSLSTSVFDAMHGTDYHEQLVSRWEEDRKTEFVGRIGLL